MSVPMLAVRDLRKNYGSQPALAGVTFEVAAGELFGLLGPNGAGKSTLLSIVAGLLDADGGEVRLAGQLFRRRDRALRRLIGIVPQDLALYNELTARENLRFFGQLYDLRGAELERRVEQILGAVALLDRADERAGTFSGGMNRRLNLGAALVHQPRLLLLDEPTTGVDPQSRNHIFEEVRRLNAAVLTVIYTSHYMEEVQALCTRVGIMDQGRLIACAPLPALLQELPGRLRVRVRHLPPEARARLAALPILSLRQLDALTLELECRDVKETLLQVVPLLSEAQIELTSLEMQEPNLEHVFLHLTGRALRD
jgi:ABC-2 type transport system ATP-binding protein